MFTFTHRNPEMQLEKGHTALVLTDIQNEFLSEDGSYYPMIEHSLKANKVHDHLEELMLAAKEADIFVIHSPHYYYPTDRQWVAPGGAISHYLATEISFVGRKDPVDLEGFVGSGADYPERYKKYLRDGHTAHTSPHKGASARTNDVIKQLRMRHVEKVIMAGPVANICLEGHMRDIIEEGMEVAMVRDAVAGGRNEEGDAYLAAMVNYRYMANALWTTEEAVKRIKALAAA
ncbi:cysteine hydrolase family protein [Paraburkholderia sp. 32]|uniref:cysteine hydrolase family protein n=1 Tax=Paraburkholderia sp. 32 TaxID=2991057 RepID=UPI003D1DDA8A